MFTQRAVKGRSVYSKSKAKSRQNVTSLNRYIVNRYRKALFIITRLLYTVRVFHSSLSSLILRLPVSMIYPHSKHRDYTYNSGHYSLLSGYASPTLHPFTAIVKQLPKGLVLFLLRIYRTVLRTIYGVNGE